MPKPHVGQNYVQKGDWLLFSKTDSLAFSIEWLQDKQHAREKYYLVDCWWWRGEAIPDYQPDRVALWIADIYYEQKYGEDLPELKLLNSRPYNVNELIADGTWLGKKTEWVKAKVTERNWLYGQDAIPDGKSSIKRWLVYHPKERTATQACFLQGSFEAIASQAIPLAAHYGSRMALRSVDPSGMASWAMSATGLVSSWTENAATYMKGKFGDSLRSFADEAYVYPALGEQYQKQFDADQKRDAQSLKDFGIKDAEAQHIAGAWNFNLYGAHYWGEQI